MTPFLMMVLFLSPLHLWAMQPSVCEPEKVIVNANENVWTWVNLPALEQFPRLVELLNLVGLRWVGWSFQNSQSTNWAFSLNVSQGERQDSDVVEERNAQVQLEKAKVLPHCSDLLRMSLHGVIFQSVFVPWSDYITDIRTVGWVLSEVYYIM